MAHFAEIDKNGVVLRVLVTDNSLPNEGKDWLESRLGGTWVQTSYNTWAGQHLLGGTPLRGNFAGIGMVYDKERDAFIFEQPYPSWVFNEQTYSWEAPIPIPDETKRYQWNEDQLNWIEITE